MITLNIYIRLDYINCYNITKTLRMIKEMVIIAAKKARCRFKNFGKKK